jgi:hypothetical protein
MMIEFLPEAEDELRKAINYYNEKRVGLGYEFAEEVKNTLKRITHYPEAWTVISRRARRCQTNRFPYGVIYQIREDMILIVAVMHLHRKPGYWKSRIS